MFLTRACARLSGGPVLAATVLIVGCGGIRTNAGTASDAGSRVDDAGVATTGEATTDVPDGAVADTGTTTVDVSVLTGLGGGVLLCNPNYAHPNVCCRSGPAQPTICVESQTAPFRPCARGALTFPDPRTCCSLADGRDCGPVPPFGAAADGAAASTCYFPCGPGGYSPDDVVPAFPLPACWDLPSMPLEGGVIFPAGVCVYCCTYGGRPKPTSVCAENASSCFATGPCPVYPTFGCGPCPTGWEPAPGIPDLCCRGAAGVSECFSQAAQILVQP